MKERAYNRFVFIDTETGGTIPGKHSLLSVGLAVWEYGKGIIAEKEWFVFYDNYTVTETAKSINKFDVTNHNKKAIKQNDFIDELLNFCYEYFDKTFAIPIAGHNVQFDIAFLKVLFYQNHRSFNQYFSHRYIDTYSVFKTCVLAGIIKEKIDSSSDAFSYFGIKVKGRHSALGDCVATVELYEKLIELIKQ